MSTSRFEGMGAPTVKCMANPSNQTSSISNGGLKMAVPWGHEHED